jgi:PII-like signaling protein
VSEALTITTYFGERDRADGGWLADALAAAYAREELRASIVLRGAAGFGAHHHLRTDRLLTLSEDLPMVSVAVGEPARIEAVLGDVRRLSRRGLVTVEPAAWTPQGDGEVRLTLYAGSRSTRAGAGRRRRGRSSTSCIDMASRGRACCSAWTAPRTAGDAARGSPARTRTSR